MNSGHCTPVVVAVLAVDVEKSLENLLLLAAARIQVFEFLFLCLEIRDQRSNEADPSARAVADRARLPVTGEPRETDRYWRAVTMPELSFDSKFSEVTLLFSSWSMACTNRATSISEASSSSNYVLCCEYSLGIRSTGCSTVVHGYAFRRIFVLGNYRWWSGGDLHESHESDIFSWSHGSVPNVSIGFTTRVE